VTLPLRRDRHFVRYWTARTISLAGSATSLVLLPVLVYDRTRSAALTGALSAAQFGPYLLFGLTAGAVADRVDRRRVMVGAEVASAVLLATVPLAAALGALTTTHVLTVAFLVGCLYVWFDAANFGALPHLVGRPRLPEAVGAVGVSSTVADVAGPAYVVFTLITITLRQQLTPDGLSSRVNTTARMLAVGAQPLGALIGGLLVSAIGVRETLLVMAAGVLGSAVLGWLSPVRRPLVRT
jgi:MFS family permease